jgi:hypothetical protein
MNTVVENLKSHYQNGLSIDDFLPISKQIEILEEANPGELVEITWSVNNQSYSARVGNLEEKDIPYFRCSIPIKCSLIDRLLMRPLPPTPKRFVSFDVLPDHSGFLRFESGWDRPDNCLLLDAYGKERMRLTVPWELTGREIAKDAVMCFKNVSAPYVNPKDGKQGQFGVSAYIEGSGSGGYAEGDWYFELDYHTGKFLWGKEIRS